MCKSIKSENKSLQGYTSSKLNGHIIDNTYIKFLSITREKNYTLLTQHEDPTHTLPPTWQGYEE